MWAKFEQNRFFNSCRLSFDFSGHPLLSTQRIKIRSVAQVTGHMISSFPAVEYGPLYYRKLEKDKPWLYLKLRVISKLV